MALTKNFGLYVTNPEDDPRVIDWRAKLAGSTDSNMTKIDELLATIAPMQYSYNDLSSDNILSAYTTIKEAVQNGRAVYLRYEDYILPLIQTKSDQYIFGYIMNSDKYTTVTITANNFSAQDTNFSAISNSGTELSDDIPKAANGDGSAGSSNEASRADHEHPEQKDVTGNSGTATKLKTPRNVQTDLESETSASFDGSKDVEPGVTGILPVKHGGTGANTAEESRNNLEITPANIGALASDGGTMTGDLILNGSPTADNQAATKKYVDDRIGEMIGGAS